MKYIILALTLLTTSCSGQWLSRMYEKEAFVYLENGIYVKNARTGLCYLVANSYRSMNAVCVNCDSLKNERVLIYHPQNRK
jgi:hypothetical protein